MEIFRLFLIAVGKNTNSKVISVLFPRCHYCGFFSSTKVYSNNLHKKYAVKFWLLTSPSIAMESHDRVYHSPSLLTPKVSPKI